MNKRKTRTVKMLKSINRHHHHPVVGAPTGVKPRGLARSVAKANMLRAGVQRINRHFDRRQWLRWFSPAKPNKRRAAGKAAQA